MKLLNVGCGNRFHSDWINVDLVSRHDEVEEYDLRRGLPYSNNSFDAVYHSHVLEHLSPEDGLRLLKECQRVLKPEGVLRVVVPDLEAIVRGYLQQLEEACQGVPNASGRYDWMTFELLDQMVRSQSGGLMGPAMQNQTHEASSFIRSRLGDEIENARPNCSSHQVRKKRLSPAYLRKKASRIRTRLGSKLISLIFPEFDKRAIQEMRFRQTGEVHRWMYDRFSLCRALERAGFESVDCQTAFTSRIDAFDRYQLDASHGQIRKPDSLFVEGKKKAIAVSKAA